MVMIILDNDETNSYNNNTEAGLWWSVCHATVIGGSSD